MMEPVEEQGRHSALGLRQWKGPEVFFPKCVGRGWGGGGGDRTEGQWNNRMADSTVLVTG